MSVERMIGFYLFVCAAMIVFNIVTAIVLKRRDKKTVRVSEQFSYRVGLQLEKVKNGGHCDAAHRAYLRKKLKRTGNMIAFDRMLESVYAADPETVKKYLWELDSVFIFLCAHYSGKDRIEAAYFPYIVKKYRLIAFRTLPTITEAMLSLLDEPSIYCRENAMQALYTGGDSECILRALQRIDRSGLFYHGKLISDGLLNFAGSAKELADKLVARFDTFSTDMKLVLLNYIRFALPDYCAFAYGLLRDETQKDEIRYSAIRYLGKYRYDEAYGLLCALASDRTPDRWQYTAIASSALAIYPGAETAALLKENLCSPNWYIRLNSAESLERMGMTYTQLADVLDGNDRYAAEILRYRLQRRKRGAAAV